MNNATLNICEQVCVWPHVFISLGYIHRGRIAELYGNSVKSFEEISNCFSKWLHPIIFLLATYEVQIYPHSFQHLELPDFLILATLVDTKIYLL